MYRLACLLLLLAGPPALAQAPTPSRDELLMHFNGSMEKFIALAKAMPADRYAWRPDTGVMSVAHVYAHVAHYNYAYPSGNMNVPVPAGLALDTLERVSDKAQIVALLEQSAAYVRTSIGAMSDADLSRLTRLYGRDVPRWAVALQLVAHMNEHLGQSIAYARMNRIAPPWSQ